MTPRSLPRASALLIILATSAPSFGQGGPEGLYRLQSLGGGGGRPWELTGNLDGVPVKKFGRIKLTDTQTGPGAVILKEDGTAEVKWKHRIHIGYDYQPDYYQQPPWLPDNSCTEIGWDYENYYPLVGGDRILPFNDLVVEFDTEGTGTWSGASLNVTCDSTCSVIVKYKPENSMQLQSETFTANVTGVLVNASMTGLPDYAEVKVDMLKTFIQQLANQHLTGDRYLAVEDALRNGLDRVTPSYPCGPSGGEFINKVVKNWSYDSTTITCSPTDGGLQPFYEKYYLLDVSAPYGFFVLGDWGSADGFQEVEFRYDGDTYRTSVEPGYAEIRTFDYERPAPLVEADIISDGGVVLTLQEPLIKVPVSPWAAPAGQWSSSPGVRYRRSPLDWPISMAATRALADASLLTGLWGISGNASSRFEVAAHSEGIPQAGDLTANVAFKVAKKELSFSLNGRHQTILNGSGLTAEGEFASTPLEANLSQRVTLLSLVPGANAAVSALGPFGQRLVGGAGAFVEAGVSGSASGTYEALPGDADPRFTSGTLEVGAYIKAQVNPVPKFARGVVNLEISGGGGAAMVINLAPNPSVASLTGFLNFALKASIFNLEAETDKTWTFGDPLPLAPAKAPKEKAAARGQAGAKAAADTLMPPGTQPDIAFGPFGPNPRMIFYAEPHPTLPAPATRIVVHYRDFDGLPWQRRTTAEAGGKANFAPVFAQPLSTPSIGTGGNFSRGVAVWVQATGAAPATTGDLAAYMNTTELRFDYYNTSSFGGGFDGTERELTSNAAADFGPSLVNCRSNSDVRLFWVRGEGMDLTGSTTPLQILTRSWTTYHPGAPANDPSTAWSAEATASSGLAHIVDWTAAAWDTENAAIAIVADMDGDLATLDDTELWLAREMAGTWAAPVRLTTNAVADEAPVLLFKSATSLALGWRQGDTVVGTFDYDAAPAPATWFDAASGVADEWGGAKLDYRASEDSLVLLWSRGTGIAYTEQAYAAPDAGSAWPAPRFHDFGSGVVAEFATKFDANSDPGEGTSYLTAVVENASEADLNTVPAHENACILTAELAFGPDARTTRLVETYSSIASPQVGDDLLFGVRAESPNPLTYTWSRDGADLSHFTGPELTLHDLTFDDEGTYVVTISDGASLVQQPFDLAFPMTYATWIARRVPGGGADLGPQDDRDRDGCQNVLEYLFDTDPQDPGERPRGELTASGIEDTGDISFLINRRATDLTYAIEFSTDFQTWTDVTASFATFPISGGIDARHLFAPFNAESFNSFENFGEFPVPVEAGGSFRVRILSLD